MTEVVCAAFAVQPKVTHLRLFNPKLGTWEHVPVELLELTEDSKHLFDVGSKEVAEGLVNMLNSLPHRTAMEFVDELRRAYQSGVMLAHLAKRQEE